MPELRAFPELLPMTLNLQVQHPIWYFCILILSLHLSSVHVCHSSFHSTLPFIFFATYVHQLDFLSGTHYGFISQMIYILKKRLIKVSCSRLFVLTPFRLEKLYISPSFLFVVLNQFSSLGKTFSQLPRNSVGKVCPMSSPWPQTDVNLLKNSRSKF